jgi:HK97 family phage major capsid protein
MSAKLAVPNTADGLKEALLDKKVMSTILDEGSLPEFMTNYVTEFGVKNPDVEGSVKEQIDAALANFARENNVAEWRKGGQKLTATQVREDDFAARKSASKWNEHAAGKSLDGKYETLFKFLKIVDHHADPREEAIGAAQREIKNAMSSTDPGSGGFLIPEEFRSQLLRVALESAIVRPRARVIPMASLRTSWPAIDATTNNGSVYGGIIGYWTEEGAALIQSQPAFMRIALEAKKLTAYTEVPNELIQDSSPSVDALVNELFPEAVAWFEDLAFLRGTGAGEPLGVLNPLNAALLSVAAETGQPTSTIQWENIVNMYARMLPSSLNSAVWLASPNTFPQLATMALSVGTGGSAVWLNNGQEGPPMTILGRPVIFTEKAASLTNAGDLSFIDFNQYLLGDRMAMSAEVSPHYKFGNDVTAYRFIERVDGRPWMQSAVTPSNGGPTLSPYVQLAAR